MKKIGLALGGGGARGFAHVLVLELFDELGIKPHRMAGTSIGAILGTAYAAGRTGADLRQEIDDLFVIKGKSLNDILRKRKLLKTIELIDVKISRTGLMRSEKIINYLFGSVPDLRFEDLAIPMKVVATDFWTREQVVFDKGPVHPAVRASMSVPGVFKPVVHEGRVLVDGGAVNNVPYDTIMDECDITVAIDVIGVKSPGKRKVPSIFDAVLSTFEILQNTTVQLRLQTRPPDIYIRPEIRNVEILEFDKATDIFEQAKPAADELRERLEKAL